MSARAADVVLVLGDIGEMREKAEGADDLQRLGGGQTVEHRFESPARAGIFIAAKANRVLANMLDRVEDGRAPLFAHRIAEDAAEQPDILAQRQVFIFGLDGLWFWHGLPLFDRRRRPMTAVAGTMPYRGSRARFITAPAGGHHPGRSGRDTVP